MGDLIEGGTKDTAEWIRQWDSFDARASVARAPIFYAGGNHVFRSRDEGDSWEEISPDLTSTEDEPAAAIVSLAESSLQPGLLWAGAAIGVSHLVQSTRAGATFGFALLGLAHDGSVPGCPQRRVPNLEGTQYAAQSDL